MSIRICPNGHITGYRVCSCGAGSPASEHTHKRSLASLKSVPTRQTRRAALLAESMTAVNYKNLREIGQSHFVGMPRKERRALAKAYARGDWREQQSRRRISISEVLLREPASV